MYIAKVLSNLGAWEKLQHKHLVEYGEIINSITNATVPDIQVKDQKHFRDRISANISKIAVQITKGLENQQWERKRIFFGRESERGLSNIDVFKTGVGLEVVTGKYTFVESDIFVKFPLFLGAGILEIGAVIVLVKSVAERAAGVCSFEMIRRRIKQVTPFVPKYPFLIIGITDRQSEIISEELTSDFDAYLFENIGLTYTELRLQEERHNCDFKEILPSQSEKIAKEICAFANNSGGGVLLIGLDNSGNKVGIPIAEKDQLQMRIGNIAKDNCDPSVKLRFTPFEMEDDKQRCVLAVRILEIERKPCMAQGKIFIRDNATAIPANPEQVRRLLLGSLG